jgi:hypothetical protein
VVKLGGDGGEVGWWHFLSLAIPLSIGQGLVGGVVAAANLVCWTEPGGEQSNILSLDLNLSLKL